MEWTAEMIAPMVPLGSAPVFRTIVELDPGKVASAVLHVSAMGVFEASINGVPVSDDVLSPGWSSYEWRLRYRSYDVTELVRPTSELSMSVGRGWWSGHLGFTGARGVYGEEVALIAQLEVDFEDGHRQVVVTDERWRADPSDVLADDLYDGMTIDARRRDRPRLPYAPVRRLEFDTTRLSPYAGPPVRRQEVLHPTRVWSSPTGRTLVDFGQNLVGWVRLSVTGPAGSEVRVRHAEVLEGGELCTRPLRDAQATDRYVLSGGQDTFEPTMTFHGFRYAEVSGWPGTLTGDDVEAVVVHSDLPRTGRFRCSDERLDRLHSNVVWGAKGNFLDLPTDCPQRDERLGWTGDLAVFAPTAAFLFDVEGFLTDWLVDLALEQEHADGRVPFVVPDPLKYLPPPGDFGPPESAALWSDAAVWVPWALYEAYGDPAVLARQYASMTAHVRRVESLLSDAGLWDGGFQFGDWLDPDAPPDQPWAAKADSGVVATACAHRSARLLADAATVLGHHDDAATFAALADRVRAAFVEHYVEPDGRIRSDCTTAYTLAIVLDLLDPELERLAGERLAALVRASGHRISTGFAGTPYVLDALTRTGHLADAYALLLQTECPSWLYPVTMGATTIWERWDSMLPDGSVNPGEMTSFNHYALGAVADWLHRTVGGLQPLEPGYAGVRVAPRPGGGITWAETSLDSRHGTIAVRWELVDGGLEVETTVPEGVRAVLSLEGRDDQVLPSGTTTTRV